MPKDPNRVQVKYLDWEQIKHQQTSLLLVFRIAAALCQKAQGTLPNTAWIAGRRDFVLYNLLGNLSSAIVLYRLAIAPLIPLISALSLPL